ncbi:MAG TPA: cupredoxin domain-containing protein [Caulobacteraceae bacterium]|nr:cupredoxin domain-containing protein [Caulobacteraceae bacterium]
MAPLLALAAASAAAAAMPGMNMGQPEWAAFGEPGRTADRTVAISAVDSRFKPDNLWVRRGETIRFIVTNRGKLAHEFVIGDAAFETQHRLEMARMPDMKMNGANELSLRPGQTRTLTWRFTRAGELQFACDLPGHAGMVGHLHVR